MKLFSPLVESFSLPNLLIPESKCPKLFISQYLHSHSFRNICLFLVTSTNFVYNVQPTIIEYHDLHYVMKIFILTGLNKFDNKKYVLYNNLIFLVFHLEHYYCPDPMRFEVVRENQEQTVQAVTDTSEPFA